MRVVVADDHWVMRRGLMELLSGEPGVSVIGEACDGEEAVELASNLNPDLVLMDISMPKMDGIKATEIIKARHPDIQVVAISMHKDQHCMEEMYQAGATAYIVKGESFDQLLEILHAENDSHGRVTE